MISLPRGVAAGCFLIGFLVGVALHSLDPQYIWTSVTWVVVALVSVCLTAACFIPAFRSMGREFILVIGILFGLCRFQMMSHTFPRNIKPFDPKGLGSETFSLQSADQFSPAHWTGRVRTELTKRANKLLPRDEAGLLVGILYGDKQLSPQQKTMFRRIGLSHIVAVSGSNITIVIGCLMAPLLWAGVGRRWSYVMASIGIFLFVFLALPSASVVRAAFMGWLMLTAPMVGRLASLNRLLLISAVVYVWWHPWSLLFDPSFALSFLAMFGLNSFGRWLDTLLKKRVTSDLFREIICSSLGATIMTTPYILWAFRQANVLGLIANVLILPIIPWTMAFGALALLFPRFPWLAWPASGCLTLMLTISGWIGSIPFGSWSKLTTSFGMMLVLYAGLYLIWRLIKRKKPLIPRGYEEFLRKILPFCRWQLNK